MQGFCFSTIGKELEVQHPDSNTDFFLFLTDYAKLVGASEIAMTYDDMKFGRLGVKDLLNYGFKVIIVDPTYSPIDDEDVIPVWVHRMVGTLDKHHPDCIVIGSLIGHFHSTRRLEKIKSYFQDGDPSYSMNVLKSGWVVRGTTGNDNQIISRVYEYVKDRDYELESNK